jgi:hypothetical protein
MNNENRTYGFMIDDADWAGCPSITAKVMAREGDAMHPINPRSDGESEFWGAPKRTTGLLLSDLTVRTYLSNQGPGRPMLIGPSWEFESVHYVGTQKARKLLHSCRRIEQSITKLDAREHGDVLMAVAAGLGLSWYVERVGPSRGRMLTHDIWRFGTLAEARDRYRAGVEKLRAQLPADVPDNVRMVDLVEDCGENGENT